MEVRKTELLKTEEDLKIQLAKLEESLLEELANAKGRVLHGIQNMADFSLLVVAVNESIAEASSSLFVLVIFKFGSFFSFAELLENLLVKFEILSTYIKLLFNR